MSHFSTIGLTAQIRYDFFYWPRRIIDLFSYLRSNQLMYQWKTNEVSPWPAT